MSEKEKPLPAPPSTPFGPKRRFEQRRGEDNSLIADKLAAAMAEGKIDEYIKQELPDNEQARRLTEMMMGMSGMAGMMIAPPKCLSEATPVQPPEDLMHAVFQGDVKGVMEVLRREHEKNNPDDSSGKAAGDSGPVIEKEIVDDLAAIAGDNSLSIDWLILRALKLYVQEYKKTGKL